MISILQRTLLVLTLTLLAGSWCLAGSLEASKPDENATAPREPVSADAQPEDDTGNPTTAEEEPQAPLGPLPGYAAGKSYNPQYQSHGFQPVTSDGKAIYGPDFGAGFAPRPMQPDPIAPKPVELEIPESDAEGEDDLPAKKAAQPSPAERPLPAHPADQYNAILSKDPTSASPIR